MAGAGFYYEPTGSDRAICFQCGICLLYWEPTDEPWSEHERHSTHCPYVMGRFTENVPLLISDATSHAQQHFSTQLISCWSSVYESNFWGTGSQDGVATLWDLQHGFTPLRLLQLGQYDSNRVDRHKIGWLESKFFVEVIEQSSHPEVEFVVTPPATPGAVPSPPPNLPELVDQPAVTPKTTPEKPTSADKSTDTEVKPTDTEVKPTDTVTKPVDTEVKPVDTVTKPVDTGAKPIDLAVKPTDTVIIPENAGAKPVDTVTKATPVDTEAKPVELAAKPTDTVIIPVDTDSKPTEPPATPSDTLNTLTTLAAIENSVDTDTKPEAGDKPTDLVDKLAPTEATPTLDKATLSADDSDDVTPVSTAPDTPQKQPSDHNAAVNKTGASLLPDAVHSEGDKQTGIYILSTSNDMLRN